MAMGRAVVTTSAGINGLDLSSGKDIVLANTAEDMAAEIERLFANPAARHHIETAARQTVERDFSWDTIATRQAALYSEITRSRES
jgi:glycosyltransferase involved in cell wall biosynthesis